jgi:hypothetical protein
MGIKDDVLTPEIKDIIDEELNRVNKKISFGL